MKILVYPRDPNPYQGLLYRKIINNVVIKYLEPPLNSNILGIILFPFQLVFNRILCYNIFHLHWTYNFKFPINNFFFNTVATIYFLLCISFIKLLGYKLVWTVHNVLPHEKQFLNDVWARIFLSKLCDAKIVHSKSTIGEMRKLGLNTKNTYITSLGSYIGVYKNNITKESARKYFKFNEKDFVFLFFGMIELYKGVEDLLETFKQLIKKRKNARLLIAGKCSNKDIKMKLDNYKIEFKEDVKIYTEFIKNDEIQYYFNCADVAVFPFKKITTSSSVILALSFGKPIICPEIGDLKELPNNIGFFYKPRNKKGLLNCMEKVILNKEKLEKIGKNSFDYANSLSWDKIAEKTYNIYKNLESLK